jgi:hypothetical protein
VYGRGGEEYNRCVTRELRKATVPPRRGVSRVMRFIDNHEIVVGVRRENRVCAAKPLEGDEICACPCRRECVSPHRSERGGRNHESVREPASYCGSNERLAHADIVAEEDTAELIERRIHSAYCGLLMGLQCDRAKASARLACAEHDLSNSRAYDRRRL